MGTCRFPGPQGVEGLEVLHPPLPMPCREKAGVVTRLPRGQRGADCAPLRGLAWEPPSLGLGVQNTGPGPSLSAPRPHLLFQALALGEVTTPRALLAAPRPQRTSACPHFPVIQWVSERVTAPPGTHSGVGAPCQPPAVPSALPTCLEVSGLSIHPGQGRTPRWGGRSECLPMPAPGPRRGCGGGAIDAPAGSGPCACKL